MVTFISVRYTWRFLYTNTWQGNLLQLLALASCSAGPGPGLHVAYPQRTQTPQNPILTRFKPEDEGSTFLQNVSNKTMRLYDPEARPQQQNFLLIERTCAYIRQCSRQTEPFNNRNVCIQNRVLKLTKKIDQHPVDKHST
jgi:hypothetical protein